MTLCQCPSSLMLGTPTIAFALAQAHPKFFRSLQTVLAHRVQLPSKRDELLGNFKLSVRGSIRKAPNVVSEAHLLGPVQASVT